MLRLAALAFGLCCALPAEWRPLYHFSPRSGFMNDPNGLVYYSGEFHLFYQHNPYGDTWGHMSWGHAVSDDLLHWHDLLEAMRESGGVMIFSGSAVVDRGNTSGLCKDANCLIAVYTGNSKTGQTQNISFSNDDGRTFIPYDRNPVIDLGLKDFRDPKVFWYAPGKQWIMVVALSVERKVRFFSSSDLKRWSQLSDFGPAGAIAGVWECPDLFELPVENRGGETRWILKVDSARDGPASGPAGQYFVGRFDGTTFRPEAAGGPLWIDYGKDFYAAQSYSDAPGNRRIWIGWMDNWQYANQDPTRGWRGMQSIPRELRLVETPAGLRLRQSPVPELRSIRGRHASRAGRVRGDAFEISSDLAPGPAECGFVLKRGETQTVIGVRAGEVFVDRTNSGEVAFSKNFPGRHPAPLPPGDTVHLHVFVDSSSVEVFANDGEAVISDRIYPPPGDTQINFYSQRTPTKPRSLEVWELRPTIERPSRTAPRQTRGSTRHP